ncbi:hypothetical protein ACA910_001087 [Epithemia clementina (nom. ined.)]
MATTMMRLLNRTLCSSATRSLLCISLTFLAAITAPCSATTAGQCPSWNPTQPPVSRPSKRLRDDDDTTVRKANHNARNFLWRDDEDESTPMVKELEGLERSRPAEDIYFVDEDGDRHGLLQTLGEIALALLPSPHRLSERRRPEDINRVDNRWGYRRIWNTNDENAVKRASKHDHLPLTLLSPRAALAFLADHFLSRSSTTDSNSPILTRALHALASSVRHNNNTLLAAHYLMDQARDILRHHPDVAKLLGNPLSIAVTPFEEKSTILGPQQQPQQQPHLQHYSSHGRGTTTTTQIELSFTLSGSNEAGVAYLLATTTNNYGDGGMIELLTVTGAKSRRSIDVINRQKYLY